ncbi:hypothetical protein ACFQ07_28415, partial [Actinomadura adrarensis]
MATELRNAADYPHKMPSPRSLRRYVERWEAGQVVQISERYRILYARALDMTVHDLFDPDPHDAQAVQPGPGDVAAIRGMITALVASDRQFGGHSLRKQASTYLTDVIEPRLRGRAPDPLRRSLFGAATEFTMRVSAMHLDADQPAMALSLLGRASSMAAESGDTTLTAWILARRGELELHQAALMTGTPQGSAAIRQAIAYTDGAVGVASATPPVSRAFLTTKSALAWSHTGDRARTQRVLGA